MCENFVYVVILQRLYSRKILLVCSSLIKADEEFEKLLDIWVDEGFEIVDSFRIKNRA